MPGHLSGGRGYQLLDVPTKKQVDTNLRRLMHLVETGRFQHVFIAVDADYPGMIGVGEFAAAPVVREYIYQGINTRCVGPQQRSGWGGQSGRTGEYGERFEERWWNCEGRGGGGRRSGLDVSKVGGGAAGGAAAQTNSGGSPRRHGGSKRIERGGSASQAADGTCSSGNGDVRQPTSGYRTSGRMPCAAIVQKQEKKKGASHVRRCAELKGVLSGGINLCIIMDKPVGVHTWRGPTLNFCVHVQLYSSGRS